MAMLAAMMPTADHSYYEALALMELVNTRLLDGRLARMRLRYRSGQTIDRQVLDDQALSRLVPEAAAR